MKLISIIDQKFQSSSIETEQYSIAKRKFRIELKRLFPEDTIIIGSCPHFEITGFIERKGKYVYFSTGDLRGRDSMLVRTAKHDKDYTGGCNYFVKYYSDFDEHFVLLVNELFEGRL